MNSFNNKKSTKIQYDVIVIGGGLGGLIAGATLAKKGKSVLLLEKHYIPGGCATTFKRKDYVMEVGLHEMDGLNEYDIKNKIFEFLEIDKNINFLKVPELFNYKSENEDYIVPDGKLNFLQSIIDRYPKEETGIKKLINTMEGVLKELSSYPKKRWQQLAIFPVMPFIYPNILKTSIMNLGTWLDRNIKDESLKLLIQANLAYYHDDPYTMSMLYFSTAQSSFIGGGGHFIQGGSQKLSNYLAEFIEKNGGKIALGKSVEKIIIDNGKAVGVTFKDNYNSDKSKVDAYAQAIIGNAAAPLIANMLPEKYGNQLKRKLSKYKPACSLISIYIGFNKNLKEIGVNHYTTISQGTDVKSIKDVYQNYKGDWSKKSFIFVDYGQIDSKLAPPNKSVGVIASTDYFSNWENLDEESYKIQKDKIANLFIDRLEKIYPGIRECIDYYTVGTSKTINRYTSNPMGTPYGYAQLPNQSGLKRLPIRSQINNLYFASAWSFPGGGFTGTIISGFQCADEVANQLKDTSLETFNYNDDRVVRVINNRIIAKNTIELTIEKPKKFTFNPGQYVILKLHNMPNDAIDISHRELSVVSHPSENNIRLAMRTGNSEFKKICSLLKANDSVSIYGPLGNFKVTESEKNIVFLAAGIGITPICSMLSDMEIKEFNGNIKVIASNKNADSTPYKDFLNQIGLKNYDYIPIYTQEEGRINESKLKEILNKEVNYTFYIVGSNRFIKNMKNILKNIGFNSENIKIDDFR